MFPEEEVSDLTFLRSGSSAAWDEEDAPVAAAPDLLFDNLSGVDDDLDFEVLRVGFDVEVWGDVRKIRFAKIDENFRF